MPLFSDPKADEIAADIASGMPRDQVYAKHADYFDMPPAGAEAPVRSAMPAAPALNPADISAMNDADAAAKMRAALAPQGPIAHEAPQAPPLPQEAARIPATPMGFAAPAPAPILRPAAAPVHPPGAVAGAGVPPSFKALGVKLPEKPNALAQELSKYGGTNEDQLAAEEGYQEAPPPQARGLALAGEHVEEAPVKMGQLDRSEREQTLDQRYAAEADAIQAEQDATRMANWAQHVGARKQQEIAKGALMEDQARSAKFQDLMQRHAQLGKEISQMSITEPTLWTGNTGKDILKGIGLALMGLGDPKAMQAEINTQIDRNLAVQKDKIAKKRGDFDASGLLLNQVAKQYDDEAMQTAAAKALAIQGVNDEIQHFIATTQDPAVRARGEAMLANGRLSQQEHELAFESTTRDHVNTAWAPPKPTGGGMDPLAALKRQNAIRHELGQDNDLYVPQAQGYATNKESAQALRKAGAEKDALTSDVMKMEHITAQYQSAKIPLSEAKKQFNAARADAKLHYKNRDQLRLGDGTEKLFDELLPSVSITDPNAPAAWRQVRESLAVDYGAQTRNHGIVNGEAPPNYRGTAAPKLTPERKGAEE